MKDLITAVASLLLIMVFVLQFSAGQVLHHRMFSADMAVESFRDTVKTEGYISEYNKARLKMELSRILGCSAGDISVAGGTGSEAMSNSAVTEGGLIYYHIAYPLQNLISAAAFFGIEEDENRVWHKEEGWVVSRVEEPDNNGGDSDIDDNRDSVSDGLQQPGSEPETGEMGL